MAPSSTEAPWKIRLYLVNDCPKSTRIHDTVSLVCNGHLQHAYEIEVCHVLQHAKQAREDGVTTVPALVRMQPGPKRIIIGDLANPSFVLIALNLVEGLGILSAPATSLCLP